MVAPRTITGSGSITGSGNINGEASGGGGGGTSFTQADYSYSVGLWSLSASRVWAGRFDSGTPTSADLALWNQIPDGVAFTIDAPSISGTLTLTKTSAATIQTSPSTLIDIPTEYVSGDPFLNITAGTNWTVSW